MLLFQHAYMCISLYIMHILTKCGKVPGKCLKFSQRKFQNVREREKKQINISSELIKIMDD